MQQLSTADGRTHGIRPAIAVLWKKTAALFRHMLPVDGRQRRAAARVLPLCLGMFLVCGAISTAAAANTHAAGSAAASEHPDKKHVPGKTWNVILVDDGCFNKNCDILSYTVMSLARMKLIDIGPFPILNGTSEEVLWKRLAGRPNGRLRFLSDGFYSYDSNQLQREKTAGEVIRRVREKGDVDMILAMGVWAGRDMAEANLGIPVVVMGCNEVVTAGIVNGEEYSGIPNVHAANAPRNLRRMLQYFYSNFPVTSVGIAFDDSPAGKRISYAEQIIALSKEMHVNVLEHHAPFFSMSPQANTDSLRRSMDVLISQGAQAIIFLETGTDPNQLPSVLVPLLEKGLPSFSMRGELDVKNGVLMCMTYEDESTIGRFEANVIKKIIDGQQPGDIKQICPAKSGVTINMENALEVGWVPTFDKTLRIDTAYRSIGGDD